MRPCAVQVLERTLLEWFLFGTVDDAIITWTTSFSLSAVAALGAPTHASYLLINSLTDSNRAFGGADA